MKGNKRRHNDQNGMFGGQEPTAFGKHNNSCYTGPKVDVAYGAMTFEAMRDAVNDRVFTARSGHSEWSVKFEVSVKTHCVIVTAVVNSNESTSNDTSNESTLTFRCFETAQRALVHGVKEDSRDMVAAVSRVMHEAFGWAESELVCSTATYTGSLLCSHAFRVDGDDVQRHDAKTRGQLIAETLGAKYKSLDAHSTFWAYIDHTKNCKGCDTCRYLCSELGVESVECASPASAKGKTCIARSSLVVTLNDSEGVKPGSPPKINVGTFSTLNTHIISPESASHVWRAFDAVARIVSRFGIASDACDPTRFVSICKDSGGDAVKIMPAPSKRPTTTAIAKRAKSSLPLERDDSEPRTTKEEVSDRTTTLSSYSVIDEQSLCDDMFDDMAKCDPTDAVNERRRIMVEELFGAEAAAALASSSVEQNTIAAAEFVINTVREIYRLPPPPHWPPPSQWHNNEHCVTDVVPNDFEWFDTVSQSSGGQMF